MATIGREAARAPLTSADINDDTITADDLVATLDLSSKTLTLGALSATGNISFGDNDKAIFGAGSDLQIYHDASDSIILDNGTGNLKIQADDLVLKSADGAKEYLKGTSGGSVRIRYNNTTVLETASTGIDVTGTVTADGLTVDGDGTLQTSDGPIFNLKSTDATLESGNVVGSITFETSDSSSAGVAAKIEALGENVTGGVGLNFSSGFGGSPVKRMTIDRNGDISFYEDTGTTPKFFWDASAESLLIGQTAIPTGLGASNTKLILGNFEDAPEFVAYNSDNAVALGDKIGAYLFGNDDNNATEDHFAGMWAKSAGSSGAMDIHFAAGKTDYENDSPHMTLSYDGNVGIGNTSMSSFYSGGQQLVVGSGTSDQGITIYAGSSDNSGIYFADSTSGDARYEGQLVYFHSSNHMGFYTSASEAMRIDSSGNVDLYQGNNLTWRYAAGSTIRGSMSIDSADNITFSNTSSNTERMRITSAGLVGIGTSSPDTLMELRAANPVLTIRDTETSTASNDARVRLAETGVSDALGNYYDIGYIQGNLQFRYNTSEYMRIDSSGNLLVGKSVTTFNTTGFLYEAGAAVEVTRSGNRVMRLNRTTNDGSILEFNKDGGTVGSIGVNGSRPYLANNVNFGIKLDDFGGGQLQPATTAGAVQDNACDLGGSSARWDDIYATNGTIQTSDANEKQDIRDLSEAEARVAQAAKALLKAFRWKDSVAEKGDDARIHFGIIAQDLQAAFEAEGLDAGRYAMFIHSTWTDEETGEERSRMGVRYSELLAFIIAAL